VTTRRRVAIAVVGVLVLAAAAVWYAAGRRDDVSAAAGPTVDVTRGPVELTAGALYFRNVANPGKGVVATVPAADPSATRRLGELRCDRFAAGTANALCLRSADAPLPTSEVVILDATLGEVGRIEVPGVPSRLQLSGTGRMASWTTFVTGDSYARGSFSTRTGIVDLDTGERFTNIEDIPLYLDGARHHAMDVNYWGVTFAADDDTFYATVATGGETYLVRGSVEKWEVRTLRRNVECPSLSPDGTRLVFKKKVRDSDQPWRLHVLDLATMAEHPVAEPASVDDQVAWLDADTLAYGRPGRAGAKDIWTVPADGSGKPSVLVPGAESPSTPR
jgi:hypothetical protein